jgi:hypothetical protein
MQSVHVNSSPAAVWPLQNAVNDAIDRVVVFAAFAGLNRPDEVCATLKRAVAILTWTTAFETGEARQ